MARPICSAEPRRDNPASAIRRGLPILIGTAAIVPGILSLIFMTSWVLVLVGMLAVGAALLMVNATFSGSVMRALHRLS